MIVVLISGLSSGVVRAWTLMLRCGLAFCIASAACYFLLMLVEMYYSRLQKEKEAVEAELAEGEETDTEEISRADESN